MKWLFACDTRTDEIACITPSHPISHPSRPFKSQTSREPIRGDFARGFAFELSARVLKLFRVEANGGVISLPENTSDGLPGGLAGPSWWLWAVLVLPSIPGPPDCGVGRFVFARGASHSSQDLQPHQDDSLLRFANRHAARGRLRFAALP